MTLSRHRRGFTLLELGIVIGVAGILAAAIVPDVIESMRNRMAEKAAADVAVIHDAARLFFMQDTSAGVSGRWPGENFPGFCAQGFTDGTAQFQLLNGGYLTGGGGPTNPTAQAANFMQNPWGQFYEMSLYAPVTAPAPACMFGVSTNLPQVVADAFVSFLPQAYCNPAGGAGACPPAANGGAVPNGFVRCCSYVPKPGGSLVKPYPCPAGTTVRLGAGNSLFCG